MTEEEEPELEIIPLTPEKEHIMAAEIRRLMDEKRLFLQPNLKINDLAQMLNTNRSYIYNAINQGIGMSFAEYVNKKRIEYAVQLIDQDREILLTDVAHQSGFSSPSAFYRNFKLYMDCTPSDYQKRGASIAACANIWRNYQNLRSYSQNLSCKFAKTVILHLFPSIFTLLSSYLSHYFSL